ncbi:MAG: hypothetical protein OXG19_09645 [Chloroflexi bacterium]|nr:hypothetical protein [Chloroflexota bacterium]
MLLGQAYPDHVRQGVIRLRFDSGWPPPTLDAIALQVGVSYESVKRWCADERERRGLPPTRRRR